MLHVSLIGTGTGDGGQAPIRNGTVAETPGETQPNVVLRVVRPFVAIGVRAIHLFLATLLGLIGAGAVIGQDFIPFTDFWDLVMKGATVAATATALGFLKDVVTIFKRLEEKYPLLTGSI